MTREEIFEYVLAHPMKFKPLSPAQRLQLAVILRPDLPVGIERPKPPCRAEAA